jgi:hypothetical protein
MRIFQGRRAESGRPVDFIGVGADRQLVAGVFVTQEAQVIRHITHRTFVACVQVQLCRGITACIFDPLDAGTPRTHIKTALVGVVDTALNGRLEARLGNTAVTVIGGGAHIEGQAALGSRRLGLCQTAHRTQSQGDQGRNEDFFHEGTPMK